MDEFSQHGPALPVNPEMNCRRLSCSDTYSLCTNNPQPSSVSRTSRSKNKTLTLAQRTPKTEIRSSPDLRGGAVARHGPGGRPRRGRPARGAAASGPPSARESRPDARPSAAPLFRPPAPPQSALFPPLGWC